MEATTPALIYSTVGCAGLKLCTVEQLEMFLKGDEDATVVYGGENQRLNQLACKLLRYKGFVRGPFTSSIQSLVDNSRLKQPRTSLSQTGFCVFADGSFVFADTDISATRTAVVGERYPSEAESCCCNLVMSPCSAALSVHGHSFQQINCTSCRLQITRTRSTGIELDALRFCYS